MAVELPEWAQYVAAAVGVTLAAVAAKMGWGTAPKQGAVEVAGALIDKQAANTITDSMHRVITKYVDVQEESMTLRKETLTAIRDQTRELESLRAELRELGREIARTHSK